MQSLRFRVSGSGFSVLGLGVRVGLYIVLGIVGRGDRLTESGLMYRANYNNEACIVARFKSLKDHIQPLSHQYFLSTKPYISKPRRHQTLKQPKQFK